MTALLPASEADLLRATLALGRELSLDLSEEALGQRFLHELQRLLPGRALCLRVVDGQRHELTALFVAQQGEKGDKEEPVTTVLLTGGRRSATLQAPPSRRSGRTPASTAQGHAHASNGHGRALPELRDPPELLVVEVPAENGDVPQLLAEARKGPLRIKRAALRHTGLPADIATSARIRLTDRYVPLFNGTTGGFAVPLVAGGELLGVLSCEYPGAAGSHRDAQRPAPELLRRDEAALFPLCGQLAVVVRNQRLLHRARSYEGYLRRMIDATSALVVVVDRQQRLTIINQPMAEVTGWAPGEDLTSLQQAARGRGDKEPLLATLLLEALGGREADGVEVLLRRQAERAPEARAVFNVAALRDATGAIDGVAAMGQDLERVRSLERQVLQTERLATLGQIAAGVVHELNNPLGSISIYSEFLSRRLSQAGDGFRQDADKARRIYEGAERIQRLTRDLMSYGKPTGKAEVLVLPEVVTQALSFCDHLVRQSGVRVIVQHQDGLPAVYGVRTQLQQVIVNLVTNACHAMAGGRGEQQLRVSTAPAAAGLRGAPAVLLSVADTGGGIPEEHRARIFEPFFSTKAGGEGTGLGLPIVKNIVESHGGQVSFETSASVGTCFLVLLPALAP